MNASHNLPATHRLRKAPFTATEAVERMRHQLPNISTYGPTRNIETITMGVSMMNQRFYIETPDMRLEFKIRSLTDLQFGDLGDIEHHVERFLELAGLVG